MQSDRMASAVRRGCVVLLLAGLLLQTVSWTYGAVGSTRPALEAASLAITGLVSAVLCLLRGQATIAERLAWRAVAIGVLGHALGSLLIVTGPPIRDGHAPAGVAALRSLLFIALMVAVVVWTRVRLRPITVEQWVDGALAGVAATAIGALLLQPRVLPAGSRGGAVSGAVVQPLIVLMVLGFVAATVAIRGWRPSAGHVWLLAALGVLFLGSVAFARDVSSGSYRPGGLIDSTWPLGICMIGASSLATPGRPPRRISDMTGLVLPGVVTATMLFVLLLPDKGRELPHALAAISLAVVTLRLTFSLVMSNRAAQSLLHNSLHDDLTGVGNRTLLNDRLSHALEIRSREDSSIAVLVCDLDDFKSINDTWGPAIGDEVLVEAASRLSSTLREGDTVARVGGDEFAMLAEGVERELDLTDIAHRVLAAFQPTFAVGAHNLPVRISIGASTLRGSDARAGSAVELLTQADIAMHVAKSAGKNRLQRYRSGMTLPDSDSPLMIEWLSEAIAARQVRLAFQPVIDLHTAAIDGFESLARWDGPEGRVSPEVFIPMAERSGLAVKLGSQLLERACRQLGKWSRETATATLSVGVNLSPAQVCNEHLPSQVRRLLTRYKIQPSQLVLEITERTLLSDSETALDVCLRLHRLGVRLAIDDFGTGYSALAHLHKFPVDIIKIDKSFLQRQQSDPIGTAAFIRGIVKMADEMRLSTVIEGIETEEQLALVTDIGCRYAQGYLLGRPAPPEVFRPAPGASRRLVPAATLTMLASG